ncbi:MAG: SDR family NAD(P)-dependent oxidoreductase [Methylococcaceae bacterium]
MVNNNVDFAVIGMACRFPGADNYHQFWQNLIQGKNCISEIPKDRWDWRAYYGDPKTAANKTNIKFGGFIKDIDKFDPLFFNISPKEAAYIDPQHRLFLQTAWHAIEDAGYSVESLSGKKIGIYAGVSKNDYSELMRELHQDIAPFISTGTVHSILANRLSFLFDFHGRSEAIDTACSSGLVALHNAMRDITNGECEAALVGGVNALIAPTMFISHSKSGMLSIDGQCKTFDADANGYVRGEGVGALLIKPLDVAMLAGDHIHAVIKSSAVNHGGRANFLTSPTVEAQADVISTALAKAELDPNTISYIEAHGTGTPMGDPIEVNALKKAFQSLQGKTQKTKQNTAYCALSSVKTNIGHLESASGIAGIIKAILAMQYKEIPALQNFNTLNPYINLEHSPFYIAEKNTQWKPLQNANGETLPRRVGVSSFGMGGVNAHVILEEAPSLDNPALTDINNAPQLILISAKKNGLQNQAINLKRYVLALEAQESINSVGLQEIAYTLQVGREQFSERVAIIAKTKAELLQKISNYIDGKKSIQECFTGSVTLKKGEKPEIIVTSRSMDLTVLAEKWVHGGKLDWSQYYSEDNRPCRVPLPTYSFEKKRCWFSDDGKPSTNQQPLLTANDTSHDNSFKLKDLVVKQILQPNDFFIQDHVVQGQKMLPGVAYLELARAAYSKNIDQQPINTITDIFWLQPIRVADDEVSIDIKLTPEGHQSTENHVTDYQVMLDGTLHSKGKLGHSHLQALDLTPFNIAEIKNTFRQSIQHQELYQLFARNGLHYGPSFQPLQNCIYGEEGILSELKIPDIVSDDFEDFILHPSMMDGVFQTIVALSLLGSNKLERQYVPFYLERVEIIHPIPKQCYAYAVINNENNAASSDIKFDALVCDKEGKILVKITGLTKRAISQEIERPLTFQKKIIPVVKEKQLDIYYRPAWQQHVLQQAPGDNPHLIIFDKNIDLIQEIKQSTCHEGTTLFITPGTQFAVINEHHIEINPHESDDYLRLIQHLKDQNITLQNILYLWNFKVADIASSEPADMGITCMLRLTKAIIRKKAYKQLKLLYAYDLEQQHAEPYHAMVAGFSRTLIYECPNIRYQTVGFDRIDTQELIGLALQEFNSTHNSKLQEIIYRDNTRLIRSVVQFDQPASSHDDSSTLLKQKGVYLISGGAGGLGYIFAKYLAERYAATVLLLGRSQINTQIAEKIATIKSLGGGCRYFSADVTKKDELAQVIEEIKSTYQTINGVIHGAGVIEDAYILLKQESSFNKVIATKINGLVNLDKLTCDDNLDFFLMFSSIASLMPNQGQSDYAAANSFLDGYAALRNRLRKQHQRSGVALAINWPLWAQGGMQVTAEEKAHLLNEFGMEPLEESKGLKIFEQSLMFAADSINTGSLSQIVAIDGDKEKIAACLGIAESEMKNSLTAPHQQANDKEEVMEAVNSIQLETEIKKIFSDHFGIAVEKIDGSLNMSEFGLDSASLLQISQQISTQYKLDLKPTVFFEINTIDKFIQHVSEACYSRNFLPSRHNTSLIDIALSDLSAMQFERRFRTSEFYLKDHVVDDQFNMPGACYIEMARQGGDLLFGDKSVVKLMNNYWVSKLSSPAEEFSAYLNITQKNEYYEYEIVSYDESKQKKVHAIGQLVCRENTNSASHDEQYFGLNTILSNCSTVQYPEQIYQQIIAEGLHVGPTFMPMQQILLGHSEALSTLALPTSIEETVDDYVLHPSLLTGVFQTALISNRFDNEDSAHFIPISIDELEIMAPITDKCYIYSKAHTTNANIRKFDLVVCRKDGLIAAKLQGFSIRALNNQQKVAVQPSKIKTLKEIPGNSPKKELVAATHYYLKTLLAEPIGLPVSEIEDNEPFEVYGINSVMIVELNKSFEDVFGPLSKTLFFEYSNLQELAAYFIENHEEKLQQVTAINSTQGTPQKEPFVYPSVPFNTVETITTINQPTVELHATNVSMESGDLSKKQLVEATHQYLKTLLSKPVGLSTTEIEKDEPFESYGINSVMIVELNKSFEDVFGPLSKTLFFEYSNIVELTEYFIENHVEKLRSLLDLQDIPLDQSDSDSESKIEYISEQTSTNLINHFIDTKEEPTQKRSKYKDDDIAIIGIDGRYPGAKNVEQFWSVLKQGEDCIKEVPQTHFDYSQYFDTDPEENKIYSKKGGFIDDVDKFDAAFFNISPREAELIDPQERLFLEVTWGMLEDAGYTRQTLLDTSDRQVGVFVGALWQPYQAIGTEETIKGNVVAPSGLLYSIANRVSYFLNLAGPSLAIDTACSSSLTAIHLACQSINNGDCKLAIAGGVNLSLHSSKYLFLSQNRFLSTDGRCRSFGEGGDGYVPGEGVGALLLKPVTQAIQDGDRIYAVIKGSAVNHGGKTNGYTVPSPIAQANLIKQTQQKANIDPRTISYIEAHGTGTSLGDPIEISGLNKAFEASTQDKQFCAIGSVKSNIGHLEAAAGIASVTKVILQMKYNQLAPSIHANDLNPNIDFTKSPFTVQRELADWHQPTRNTKGNTELFPRRAGISSFGAGGANAHLILEQYESNITDDKRQKQEQKQEQEQEKQPAVIVLSAKNQERLVEATKNLQRYLSQNQHASSLNDVAYTLQIGRETMDERLGLIVHSMQELQDKLTAFLNKDRDIQNLYSGNVHNSKDAIAVFKDDDDMLNIIDIMLTKGKYQKLVELWVKGLHLDWNKLYGLHKPQRISLPIYPFAKERYWIAKAGQQGTADITENMSVLHPLVHNNTSSLSQQRFSSTFSGQEFFLDDHIVGENKVLPAVAYIEMFRAAGSLSSDQYEPCKLYNLTWLKPITVQKKPAKLSVELSVEDEEFYLQAVTESDGKHEIHAQGQLVYLDSEQPNNTLSIVKQIGLNDIAESLELEALSETVYTLLHNKGLKLQQSFQGIQWIKWNNTNALGYISLPPHLHKNERDAYYIHPCLLDCALQTALYVLEKDHQKPAALYLPFSIEEVEFFAALPDTIYSSVTPSDGKSMSDSEHAVRSFDVKLLDPDGKILVNVKNISFRETNLDDGNIRSLNKSLDEPAIIYSSPQWLEEPLAAQGLNQLYAEGIVLVSNSEKMIDTFKEKCSPFHKKTPVVEVIVENNTTQQQPGRISIFNNEVDEYQQLGAYLNSEQIDVSHIVCLWDSSIGHENSLVDETLDTLTSLFYVDQLLLKSTKPIQQLFVNLVEEGSSKWVIEGSISGFLKSVVTEYPNLSNRVISIVLKPNNQHSWTQIVIDEMLCNDEEQNSWIRYQPGKPRSKQQLIPLDKTTQSYQPDQSVFKQGGTYLISGGMGGIGKVLGNHLVKIYDTNLILLGRSALDKEGESHLATLNSEGINALYLSVDITNLNDLDQRLVDVKKTFGPINGVIHSAGVLEDNLLPNKKLTSLLKVAKPKVQGTVNLDKLTRSEPLDFFVVFSSLTSILGNPGQSDYGAANGFMDAFMNHRETLVQQQHRTGLSLAINWPFWLQGQMGQEVDVLSLLDESFGMPLDNNEGLQCFEQVLQFAKNQIAVVKPHQQAAVPLPQTVEQKIPAHPVPIDQKAMPATTSNLVVNLQQDIIGAIAKLGKFNPDLILPQSDFISLGLESVFLAKLASTLNKKYVLKISPAIFFEYTNLELLCNHLLKEHESKITAYYANHQASEDTNIASSAEVSNTVEKKRMHQPTGKIKAATELRSSQTNRFDQVTTNKDSLTNKRFDSSTAIAVIGMDCLFPGAPGLDSFWQLLLNKESAISEVPTDRWDWRAHYGDPANEVNKTDIKWGGFVDDLDKFDASFFNISPREAALMDPQQRILLQSVWKAIENAGYAPLELSKKNKVGFFVGASTNDYFELLANSDVEAYSSTGGTHSITANRVSYVYDFKGPSIAVDTACSSSLVALDMAVQSLQEGRCDVAIIGGVNALITPTLYLSFSKAGMLSPNGKISSLDKQANGYVRGEGVGVLVLKRLDKARKENDEVHAVIKGTAVNHGGKVSSLTVPSPKAQSQLIEEACNNANIDVSTLNYIEMHGTGTPLGDPIEVNGLKSAFSTGKAIQREGYCGIASVKGNIGHLEAAAGVAGLIKTVLALKHKKLPGQCNFKTLNPHIHLENTPFKVVENEQSWDRLKDNTDQLLPRRAGVSSFGFGGANSHAVLEEYIEDEPDNHKEPLVKPVYEGQPYPIVLSAKTEERLRVVTSDLNDYLTHLEFKPDSLQRIAYTLQCGRQPMDIRLGIVVKSVDDLLHKLKTYISGNEVKGLYYGQVKTNREQSIQLTEHDNDRIVDWINKDQYDELLEHWVKGLNVDWSKLYEGKILKRLGLPTYPFAKQHYWLANDKLPSKPINKQQPKKELSIASDQVSIESPSKVAISLDDLRQQSISYFTQLAASTLQMSPTKIDPTRSLEWYGMDSILVMQLVNTLRGTFPAITSTILFQYRTIEALVDHLIEKERDTLSQALTLADTVATNDDLTTPSDTSRDAMSEDTTLSTSISKIASEVANNKVGFKQALKMLRETDRRAS